MPSSAFHRMMDSEMREAMTTYDQWKTESGYDERDPKPVGRNIAEATKRVANMTDEEIMHFAQHDPDIFRDIARDNLPLGVIDCGDGYSFILESRKAP